MEKATKIVFGFLTLSFMLYLQGCGGCSRSSLGNKYYKESNYRQVKATPYNSQEKSVVEIENNNGVKYIWVEINGIKLKFIFDTGASSICISSAEAIVLFRQGTLNKSDIFGTQQLQDATGNISEGTRINLRTVKIGQRVLRDVQAIVIDNEEAPLLLGQTALEKFGKISIDNKNNIIVFE